MKQQQFIRGKFVSRCTMLTLGRAQRCVHHVLSRLSSTSVCRMAQPQVSEDQCILVDKEDRVIGEEGKSACHTVSPDGNLLLHRAFSVFLFNSEGDLLLQKRAAAKVSCAFPSPLFMILYLVIVYIFTFVFVYVPGHLSQPLHKYLLLPSSLHNSRRGDRKRCSWYS